MRRVWVSVVAIVALCVGASSALGHPERATEYPDASKGAVPKYRHIQAAVNAARNGDRIVRNTSLRPVDLSVDRIEIVDARGRRLRSTARFLQAFAHGLYPPSMKVKGSKFERTRLGQIATVKPGQDLPLTLSWRLTSSTAQPLEVRFGGGSLALPR